MQERRLPVVPRLEAVAWEALTSFLHEVEVRHRVHNERGERSSRAGCGNADGLVVGVRKWENAILLVLALHQCIVDVAVLLDEGPVGNRPNRHATRSVGPWGHVVADCVLGVVLSSLQGT